ncbi:MAG: MOSC N-terminal beta barrel domain-containing protein [Planctomycetes bacterium]|nr:MOSC N-terminal beta barrel domain-containing protein [Planctomycetota bacterium]
MASSEVVGSLAGLWRFPVKSMSREQLEQAELTERGLLGEREEREAISRLVGLPGRVCRAATSGPRAAASADCVAGRHVGDERLQ